MSPNKFSILENFDDLVKLASEDPQAFDAYRADLIEQFISSEAGSRQVNMRRFQWRIEQETRNNTSSMGRCIKLSAMMTERLNYLGQQIDVLMGRKAEERPAAGPGDKKKIIQLR